MPLTAAEERRLQEESGLLERLALREDADDAEAGNGRQWGQQPSQPSQQRLLRWPPPPLRSTDSGPTTSPPPAPLLRQRVSSSLSPGTTRCRRLLPALLLFMVAAVLLITGGVLVAVYHGKLLGVSEWMRARAPASAVYFAFFTALWVTICLPSTPVELTAGFVFGFPVAFAVLVVGKPLGCCVAFGIGRCIAADSLRDGLLKRAHGEGPDASRRARALFLAMERHPWKMTLLLRLMYFPIAFKNVGIACLPCPSYVFALCTLAASIPYTLLWAHMGAQSRSLLDLLSGRRGKAGLAWEVSVVAGGLLFALLLALLLRHYTLKYMRRLAEEEEDISEREQQRDEEEANAAGAFAGAAAADADSGAGALEEEEALLRRPLRAGPQPPLYGVEASSSSSSTMPSALPYLKWQTTSGAGSSRKQTQQQGIGLSPLPPPRRPSAAEAGKDWHGPEGGEARRV